MVPHRSNSFSKTQRLQKRWEFERVKNKGRRLVVNSLIGNWLEIDATSGARLGVITSKKVGGAVVRARARRMVREVFRLNQHLIRPVDLVIVARPSLAGKSMEQIEKNYLAFLKQAALLKE